MTRRTKIFIAIDIIAVVILLIIFLFLRVRQTPEEGILNTNDEQNIIPLDIEKFPTQEIPQVYTKEPQTQSTLIATSIAFSERFTSFSSDGNLENFRNIRNISTQNMETQIDEFIAQNRDKLTPGNSFYGISSKSIKTQIIRLNESESEAEVLVQLQRRETVGGNTNPRIFYQNLMMILVAENGSWKVDKAELR